MSDLLTVLLVDDYHEQMTAPGRLPAALEAACGGRPVRLLTARDYAEADEILNDPAARVRVVLLDQVFDRPGLRMLDAELKDARPVPALAHEQGLWIAARLVEQLGPLCPPLYLFTSAGAEFSAAGVDAEYHGKPAEYRGGSAEFDALVAFLRRHLDPVAHLRALCERDGLRLDSALVRFLDERVGGLGRDAAGVLDALAGAAADGGVIDAAAWRRAREAGSLPDSSAGWDDSRVWERVLRVFGRVELWRPWHAGGEPESTGRLRYYRLQGERRVLAVLDPRAVPDALTGPRRRELDALPALLTLSAETRSLTGLFRVALPPSRPRSRLPYALVTYFDVPPGGEWVPLSVLRARAVREGRPLAAALAEVAAAVDRAEDAGVAMPPGFGLLAEGVLVNRADPHSSPFASWRWPAFPAAALGLHPDPDAHQSPPAWWFGRVGVDRADWLRLLAYWFAWGRLPELTSGRRGRAEYRLDEVRALVGGRPVELDPRHWWRGPTPPAGPSPHTVDVQGQELHFPAGTRCLRGDGPPALRVERAVRLTDCVLRPELRAGAPLPLFEGVEFTQPVRLSRCRVESLRLVNCVFRAGLSVEDAELDAVELRDCRFGPPAAGKPALRLAGLRVRGAVTLAGVAANGTIELHALSAGELDLHAGPGADVAVARAELGALRLHAAGPASVRLEESTVAGSVRLTGAGVPAAVALRSCDLRRGLRADGPLDLSLTDSDVREDVDLSGTASHRLALDDARIGGAVDLGSADLPGGLSVSGGSVAGAVRGQGGRFGPVSVSGVSCVGPWLFADAAFAGPVCVAQPFDADPAAPARLAGAVFRDQVDFSGARFAGPADFSHVVFEHDTRFDRADFAAAADFRRLQARGNVALLGARFGGPARFDAALIDGVLDCARATFAVAPSFAGAGLGRLVRLAGVRWPATGPHALFTDAHVDGRLDLSGPSDLWVDLSGASANQIGMDFRAMRHSFDRSHKGDARRTTALARLFEASLAREVRFAEADHFFRAAQSASAEAGGWPGRLWSRAMAALWGHGTRPAFAFGWLAASAVAAAGLSLWLGGGQGVGALGAVRAAYSHVLLGESTLTDKPLPAWADAALAGLVTFQAVTLNLFFAALARKLLR